MRVAVVSANLGGYDAQVTWREDQIVPEGVEVTFHRLTDQTFPGRDKAMLPTLKCGIAKMAGYELFPGYHTYIWVDASRGVLRPDTVAWFLEQLGPAEMLLFLHPERTTIREEYEFVKGKLAAGSKYLSTRYAGEWLSEQYAAVNKPWHLDNRLYASTAFAYRPTQRVQAALRDWLYMKFRFCIHDQLALPYVVREHKVYVKESQADVYHCDHLPITRQKR